VILVLRQIEDVAEFLVWCSEAGWKLPAPAVYFHGDRDEEIHFEYSIPDGTVEDASFLRVKFPYCIIRHFAL
jgi:hypothetical protein